MYNDITTLYTTNIRKNVLLKLQLATMVKQKYNTESMSVFFNMQLSALPIPKL